MLSCDGNRLEWNTVMGPLRDPKPKGAIWVYDIDTQTPAHVPLLDFPYESDFHPLGIDVLPAKGDEPAHLFVVNHGRNSTTVEQFKLSEPTTYFRAHAEYVRTWTHPSAFHSANAIIPLTPTEFYVTNDHAMTRRLPDPWGKFVPLLETVLALPGGWVDHVELVARSSPTGPYLDYIVTRVASRIPFANGIALSPSGKEVAVVSTTSGEVWLYDRNVTSNELAYREKVFVPISPDNIHYDEKKGSLIVAGHAHFPSFVKVVEKQTTTAPSWVLEIEKKQPGEVGKDDEAPYSAAKRSIYRQSENYSVKTLYQSNGEHYGMSTTGYRHDDDLFVVGLYVDGVLQCTQAPREQIS